MSTLRLAGYFKVGLVQNQLDTENSQQAPTCLNLTSPFRVLVDALSEKGKTYSNSIHPSGYGYTFMARTHRIDYMNSTRHIPMDPAYHPPNIGNVVSHLLSESFGCQFKSSEFDIHAGTPFSHYAESLINATKLPFQVTVASLTLLQRLYMRLPEEVFELRKHFSPYQLFTAAYIVTAKQYTQFRLGLDITRLITHGEEPTFERDRVTVAVLMSNEYWSHRTSYSVQRIKDMQSQFVFALGGSVAVFPAKDIKSQEFLKQLKSLSLQRRIPIGRRLRQTSSDPRAGLANLGRMSAAEHKEYFQVLGEKLVFVRSPIEVQVRL